MTDTPTPQPAIILVHPQMGENIGMVARAMWNCGLTDLRLVAPRDGWPNPSAVAPSAGATHVVENATVYETTAHAIADLNTVYATTARPRGMDIKTQSPNQSARHMVNTMAQGGTVGVLFGGERAGLGNDDVALAHTIIEVPLNPTYKSLNLSQAVLLVAYEWFQCVQQTAPNSSSFPNVSTPENTENPPATAGEVDYLVDRLTAELQQGGFFRTAEMEPTVTRNIRNLFNRADLRKQDINTLHGIIKCLVQYRADA